jgi:hypothetical protein
MAVVDDGDGGGAGGGTEIHVKPKKVKMTRKEYEKRKKDLEEAMRVREALREEAIREAKQRWVDEFLQPLDEFTLEAFEAFAEDEDLVEDAAERREKREKKASSLFLNHLKVSKHPTGISHSCHHCTV